MTGTVHVADAPEAARAWFTPEGERPWGGDAWAPVYPDGLDDDTQPGTVFTTDLDGSHTTWVVADRGPRSMRYARVTPRVRAGTVEVVCDDDGAGGTVATVTYDLTALIPDADADLRAFASGYDDMLAEWERAIATALAAVA